MSEAKENKTVLMCGHCWNRAPHEVLAKTTGSLLYEQIEEKQYFEPFDFTAMKCGTCGSMSVLGGFRHEMYDVLAAQPVLYPRRGSLDRAVPEPIRNAYGEAVTIQERAPNAFVGQIRRALEMLCRDQAADGRTLFDQLKDLSDRGVLPGAVLNEGADLIRKVGNIGVHAASEDIDVWDAESVDELFRVVIEYVYVAPSKVERLRRRLEHREKKRGSDESSTAGG